MQISDIPVGGLLYFGSHSVQGRPPTEILWVKLSEQNDFCTAHVIDRVQYDASEHSHPNASKALHGNNCYWESNIDQYLNSASDRWYSPRHSHDYPPAVSTRAEPISMVERPGFLHHFTPHELDLLEDRQIACKVPYGRKKEFKKDYEVISRKVALPSFSEFFHTEKPAEGEMFQFARSLKNEHGDPMMKFTYSDEYAEFSRMSTTYGRCYMLRTPVDGSPCKIYTVGDSGIYTYENHPAVPSGLVPIIRLKGEEEIEHEPGSDMIWCLKANICNNANDFAELMALLNN